MKRQILWAATAGLALAGCTHVECPGTENAQTPKTTQSEITVNPFGRKMSRGIVTGAELKELEFTNLDGDNPKSRTFYMSAYNATEGTDYFIGKTFGEKTVTSGEPAMTTGTGIWGAVKLNTEAADDPPTSHWTDDPVYWPFGAKLDFLAYSQSYDELNPTTGCPKIYANWKSANEVELEVTKESRQDDILYAATSGLNSSNSNTNIGFSMIFNHAQAWLTFKLKLTAGSAGDKLTINSIKCANIYSGGRLTLKNEGNGNASADWHFFPLAPSDVTVDDPEELLGEGNYLREEATELNILLPPQDHNGFIINYTLSGRTCNLEIPANQLVNGTTTWEAGKHYTYTFSFTLNEITVAPYVTAWESTDPELWEENNDYVKKLRGIETWLPTAYSGYSDLFAGPTVNDIAHLTIPTNADTYPTDENYISLLNKILEGLQSGSVAPADCIVSDIMYKGSPYTFGTGFWHISSDVADEDHSLGKKIYDDMMESGLYTAILTLGGVQTIEIHLEVPALYPAKLHNAMLKTLADRDAAAVGSPLKKLVSIEYSPTDNQYIFTFKDLGPSPRTDECIPILWNFFECLGVADVVPFALQVKKVAVNGGPDFAWYDDVKAFGTRNAEGTDADLVAAGFKDFAGSSHDSDMTTSLTLDDNKYTFNIRLTQQAATP